VLDAAVDVLNPQPTLVERLVRPVLLPRERLSHNGIHAMMAPQLRAPPHALRR